MLQCRDGSLYTGIAVDVQKRLLQHLTGKGSRYVRSRLPATLVYKEKAKDRSSASKREAEIKSWEKIKKLQLLRRKS